MLSLIKQNGALTVQDLYKRAQQQTLTQEGSSTDAESEGVIPSMRYVFLPYPRASDRELTLSATSPGT